MKICSYPKIYNIGHPAVAQLFEGNITIEEKIDGSQFSFGMIAGELSIRSKGQELLVDHPEKMFSKAIETVVAIAPMLKPDWVYRGEYLQKAKHNALAYDRIPANHIMMYDIQTGHEQYLPYEDKKAEAARLGFEVVPLIFNGNGSEMSVEKLKNIMDQVSCLGGAKIEGFVVKNYDRFTVDAKAMMGKYVSENFKEVHSVEWKKDNPTSKDVLGLLCEEYRNKARWHKGIIHLQEKGQLTDSPKDIGPLLKEIQNDIEEECIDEIKQKLWNWVKPQILRGAIRGFPEFYKEYLLNKQFENKE